MKVNKPIRPAKKKTAARKKDAAEPLAASSAVSTALTFKLQKLLAQKGLGSRREMEVLIASGQVKLNDQTAVIGDRAGPGDIIRIGRRVIRIHEEEELPKVLLYHKPEGEIVSRSDPQDRPSVFDKLPYLRSSKWIAIGRLDFNTSGLLIFTNDGALANRMMHPRFEMEREYAVRILGELTEEQMQQLTTGITLEDGEAAFSYLADQGGEGANHWYRVILKEGKNREVRRMFEAIGLTVSRLMRVRFGPINLPPRIKRGQWLELDEKETRRLLSLIK
ncbi:23S rRNA pseudouridine(2605) synthase RluB [Nitrosomonas ureae]|uniref:Pseudouridine synthase n=1 Tax=Nitrosomonas ureae TaxID=44577 RepID=A0A0S3AKB9_9PROT|nr:pseudouridine synthase [Nitrosomonas ureae]ALQ51645.1 pseudouridine synthase [Nitrosomonas ureae]SDU27343.1 ribosomal large subunit pseudouridine synthase B [Nitrosomonas ureae]SEP83709.1 23S rRNA pseudouridine2605 synthase [Nitrosomonas ureae]